MVHILRKLMTKQIRYRLDTPLVLRGVSCTFEGGHKIGIVGRTGSGKTTLIGALFRLVEPVGGKIVVDGIDISTIGLHDLRSRFGIIPQDPTLFNGTVRYNLDPLSQHNDQEIWEVNFNTYFRVFESVFVVCLFAIAHYYLCIFEGSWEVSASRGCRRERSRPGFPRYVF